MRGKGNVRLWQQHSTGITPAYAGKRLSFKNGPSMLRDHPRVCGEKASVELKLIATLGSPPRMRGKVLLFLEIVVRLGITPAYAGKSSAFVVLF